MGRISRHGRSGAGIWAKKLISLEMTEGLVDTSGFCEPPYQMGGGDKMNRLYIF